MKKLYTLITLVCFYFAAEAQISKGKNFWFGLMQNYQTDSAIAYITTDVATTGVISIPGMGWSQNFTVTPGLSTQIVLPIATTVDVSSDVVTGQGVHVVTRECVSVFSYNGGAATADASIVYPINSIGTDYIVNTYQDVGGSGYNGASELLVIGNFVGTTVTITPSVTAGARAAGVPFNITLDSGQTYLLQATGDLTGTRITGVNGKDFSVLAGSVCISVNGTCCCDHIYEQMAPIPNLGTEYITVSFGVPQPDKYRIVAVQNGTTVNKNGALLTTLNAGQYYDYNSITSDYITSNFAFSMVQLMGSSQSGGGGNNLGDPLMIALSPNSQRISQITFPSMTFISPGTYYWYVNIVAKTADISTITLDGASLPGGTFTPVPANASYATAHVRLTYRDHHISSNQGVIGYVYGYSDNYESFGYQAGVLIEIPHLSIYDSTKAYCPGDTVQIALNTPDSAKIVSSEWDLGDGSPHLFDTLRFWHVYQHYGQYPVTLIYTLEGACAPDTAVIDTIKVLGPEPHLNGPFEFCTPQSITVHATSRVVPDSLFWRIGNNSFATVPPNESVTLFANQDTVIYLKITSAICPGYDTAYIYVNHDTAGFTFANACDNSPVNFTNTSQYVAALNYQWLWDFGDGTNSAGLSPTHTYAAGGTYAVKLKLISPAGCLDSITHSVTIYAKPTAAMIVNPVCNDSVFTPVNNTTISAGTITYDWYFGDGTPHSTAQNPSHIYHQSGAYNVTLIAAGGPGCIDSLSLPLNMILGADIHFAGTSVCSGQTTMFTNLTVNNSGSAILDYNWTFGDGNSSTLQNPSNTYANAGSYTVKLLVDYGSGCYDSLSQPVRVNALPVASFTAANLCNTGTLTPVNTSTISSGTMTDSWNFGDGTASVPGQNPLHTFAMSGSYNVQLITVSDSGCRDTVSNAVNVIRGTVIAFSAPPVCLGAATIFTDQTTNPYNTIISGYSWTFGDGNSSTQQNTTNTYAAANTYNAQLLLDYGNNCADSLTQPVIVNPQPVAAFTISDVCNDSVAAPQNNSVGSSNYAWNFGDGSGTVTGQNPPHTYQLSGAYTVQLIASSASGCADTVLNPVNVIIGTHIDFSATAVCLGNFTTFTDQTANPYNTRIIAYNWAFGDGSTATLQNTVHTYANSGTFNVQLELNYSNNCADSVTKPVTVNANPTASFTIADVCNDSTVIPQNTSTGAATYAWNFGDGSAAVNGLNPTHTYGQSNTYSVKMMAISAAGCTDSVTNPVTVVIGTHIDFTVPPVCQGNPSVYTDYTVNPFNTTINGYNWNFGDGSSAGTQNATHTYATFGNYTVLLTLTYNNNCADSLSKQVTVNQNPVADFSATTPCAGSNMQFTDLSTPANLSTGFMWTFGDGSLNYLENPAHNYLAAGTYNVTLVATSAAGCATAITKPVTVLTRGTAAFTATDVCLTAATQFTNTTDILTFPVNSFNWTFGDGTGTSTQTNPAYTYATVGTYNVTLIANFANGCNDTVGRNVNVFELPTVSEVTTNVSCFGGNDGSMALTPMAGRMPFTYNWSNGGSASADAPASAGTYLVTFTDAHTCTATGTYVVTEPTLLIIDTTVNPISCAAARDGNIVVTAAGATPGYTFNWSDGRTGNTLSQLDSGTYTVTVTDAKGCFVVVPLILTEPLTYTVILDSVATIDLGKSVNLSPVTLNGTAISWLWTPIDFLSCATCQNTIASPVNDYMYIVETVSDKGCVATATIHITVVPKYEVFVPDAFTPNGDGNNDYFEVYGNKDVWRQFEVIVFNRIGEKVFESNDMNFKWDGSYKGQLLNPAVFVYVVKVVYTDNHTDKMYKGSVTLIR